MHNVEKSSSLYFRSPHRVLNICYNTPDVITNTQVICLWAINQQINKSVYSLWKISKMSNVSIKETDILLVFSTNFDQSMSYYFQEILWFSVYNSGMQESWPSIHHMLKQ